ncbi:c-type cytochrome [Pacificibacter marinus]|uniref:Cytochrome c2 n=1 Tax=Pacificibacter marinus TaxID=658057 RepID=A0A1Y5RLL2_9RHOB|nr:c-type cytochrome [Pacificibacter marinus]SEK17979.1 sulfur dehydrogenase subunit SoxD [Pacificibacter marinus]SLN19366.1 Cytochrome c2 [Pacificibacter marinus]
MSKYLKVALISAACVTGGAAPSFAADLGLGRAALPAEIAAWDKDVSPDGTGLPVGSGSVEDGEMIFSETCASCHGEFAEGVDNWPKLAGGMDTLDHEDPTKTVGSYWPYLSTTFDYVRRSMPFGAAQTISDDDVYAMVAYILYSNDLVEEDFVLSQDNFLEVEMPNADGFIIDDRPQTEYSQFTSDTACYDNCKDSVEITMRAAVLDVTPEETSSPAPALAPAAVVETAPQEPAVEVAPLEPVDIVASFDADLAAKGEKVFKKCKACHQVGEDAKNKTGPILNGVIGAPIAHVDGFKYSKDFLAAKEQGRMWDEALLAEFLAKPKAVFKRTKMSFAGLKKDSEIASVIEYLKSVSQ